MTDRRALRIWTYLAIAVLGGLAIILALTVVVGRPVVHGLIDPARVGLWTVATAMAMAWAVAFGALAFRSKDEFEQQASRVGWYWGGTVGLAASTPVYVFIAAGGLHWLWPMIPAGGELKRAFVTGYALPVFMQFAGFLAVRAWWRLSKR